MNLEETIKHTRKKQKKWQQKALNYFQVARAENT